MFRLAVLLAAVAVVDVSAIDAANLVPEQIHIAPGRDASTSAAVQWATLDADAPGASVVEVYRSEFLDDFKLKPSCKTFTGSSFLFQTEKHDAMLSKDGTKKCMDYWKREDCVAREMHQHVVFIDGLEPDTRYWYRVVSGPTPATGTGWCSSTSGTATGTSRVFSFKTLPAVDLIVTELAEGEAEQPRPIRVAVFGDLGDYNGQSRPYLTDLLANKVTNPANVDGKDYFD